MRFLCSLFVVLFFVCKTLSLSCLLIIFLTGQLICWRNVVAFLLHSCLKVYDCVCARICFCSVKLQAQLRCNCYTASSRYCCCNAEANRTFYCESRENAF